MMTTTAEPTATVAYFDALLAAHAKLAGLQQALATHFSEQQADPQNWGGVGDLGMINHRLDQLTAFLNGDPRWDER